MIRMGPEKYSELLFAIIKYLIKNLNLKQYFKQSKKHSGRNTAVFLKEAFCLNVTFPIGNLLDLAKSWHRDSVFFSRALCMLFNLY